MIEDEDDDEGDYETPQPASEFLLLTY